ncbi:MAG: alanine racemase [Betaproteobacteria bacterium]|nr:alanine racemase [Betaproteobacteria bacterium]
MPRPIQAIIDLAALRHNLGAVRRLAPRSPVFAVIKANAYGHGLMRAASALSAAEGFALLELDAAIGLREAGYTQRIALLEGFFGPRDLPMLVDYDLAAVVHSMDQVAMLRRLPQGARLDVLLKLNTGINRLGLSAAEFAAALDALRGDPRIAQLTLMTHFANADDELGVAWQMERLDRLAGEDTLPRSLANSAAILRYPETHAGWVRPGIMLYGCSPFPGQNAPALGLQPVMTLRSEIIAIRELEPGDAVGYGGVFRAARAMKIGVVACGYADGYPRHAPNGTPIVVEGVRTGTAGRVSMDMLCVDLTPVPHARVGSPVTLWGEGMPVEEVAQAAGTVGYELLCALAPRVPVIERAALLDA